MGCGWTFPTLKEPFTIISLIYRKRHWSMCVFLFVFRAVRLVDWLRRRRRRRGARLRWCRLSFRSHPLPTFPCRRRVSSCHRVIFCPDPPPLSPSNCYRHSRRRRAATFNQTPKIAPGVWWVGGWGVGWPQTPAGSTGVMCSSPSSHNTGRGDSRPQVHLQRPLLLQLEAQPRDCGVS